MADESHLVSLAAIELLADLGQERRKALEDRCVWRQAVKGDKIVDRRDEGRDVLFIATGAVEVVNYVSGLKISHDTIGAGGCVGKIAALDGEERSAIIVAANECVVASVAPEVPRELLRDNPAIAEKVLVRPACMVRQCNLRIKVLSAPKLEA
jgi:CRP/FNR family cyclic AMP-dependent transcriptional regulator